MRAFYKTHYKSQVNLGIANDNFSQSRALLSLVKPPIRIEDSDPQTFPDTNQTQTTSNTGNPGLAALFTDDRICEALVRATSHLPTPSHDATEGEGSAYDDLECDLAQALETSLQADDLETTLASLLETTLTVDHQKIVAEIKSRKRRADRDEWEQRKASSTGTTNLSPALQALVDRQRKLLQPPVKGIRRSKAKRSTKPQAPTQAPTSLLRYASADQRPVLIFNIAAETKDGLAFTLNFSEDTRAKLILATDPAHDLAKALNRQIKKAFGSALPLAFFFDTTRQTKRLHAHGVIVLPGLKDMSRDETEQTVKILRKAMKAAGGEITGSASGRQLDLQNLYNATGWHKYCIKAAARTAKAIGTKKISYFSNDLKRQAQTAHDAARNQAKSNTQPVIQASSQPTSTISAPSQPKQAQATQQASMSASEDKQKDTVALPSSTHNNKQQPPSGSDFGLDDLLAADTFDQGTGRTQTPSRSPSVSFATAGQKQSAPTARRTDTTNENPMEFEMKDLNTLTDPRHHLAALRSLVDALQGRTRQQSRLALEGYSRAMARQATRNLTVSRY